MAASFTVLSRRLRHTLLLTLGIVALGISSGYLYANQRAPELRGPIRVIDGDTFEVSGARIRLHAIDAPESDQMCETRQGVDWACGGWITKVVKDRYSGVTASCEALDTDRYGRIVARCFALGEDVGARLVREGLAFAYPKYGADYVKIERNAAAQDRGLHAVRMQSPEQHRRARTVPPQRQVNSDCVIKGNISAKGERIYHLPGQRFYDKTRIDTRKGERWFCSEAAARAAGWRRARV